MSALRGVPAGHERSPTESLSVRRATIADLDFIAEIERGCFSDPWSRSSFEGVLGHLRVFFAVAATSEAPDTVLGYVVAWFVEDEAEIANLAVSPAARRRGVGSRLLDAALRASEQAAMPAVYLEVRESNVAARALYARRGFAEVGRRKGYYRRPVEDALVLRLQMHGRV